MKTKEDAIKEFVSRDFAGIPQDWVQKIAEALGEEIYAWPMWGTMWIVDNWLGEKLMKNAKQVVEPSECENKHKEDETCDICEDYEEMSGAWNIKDKDGVGTAAYIYEIDGQYVVGINGAGWNFYDGVWDKLYDLLELKWHETKEDITSKTLGEFLGSENETIKRNATSILKQLQKK